MDPALRLGLGHPLHPVRAALEAQPPPHAVAGHLEGHVGDAAEVGGLRAQHVHLPALRLGEGQVHLEELPGEQVGLLAALGTADLHDDVLALVGVARRQQVGELGLEGGDARLGLGSLGLQRLGLGGRGLAEQLDGRVPVVDRRPQGVDAVGDLAELLVAAGDLAEGVAVTRQVTAGEARLDVGALDCQRLEALGVGIDAHRLTDPLHRTARAAGPWTAAYARTMEPGQTPRQHVRPAQPLDLRHWIPAFAGMTIEGAGTPREAPAVAGR